MRLPPSEVERFYAIWLALISFVNQQRQVVPERLGVDPSEPWDAQDVAKIRDVLWADDALREAFIAQNPAGLSAEDLAIVASWQHRRAGAFYVLRHLKKYSVFLSAEESAVYGVLGLVSDLEDVVPFVPCYVNAVLLPWEGQIIYDSLLAPYNITFGPGIRRGLDQSYKDAKERGAIITSLLPPDHPPSREEEQTAADSTNAKVLEAFRTHLFRAGLSSKVVERDVAQLAAFAEYLANCPEPRSLREADLPEFERFLAEVRERRSHNDTQRRQLLTGLKRFVRFLLDSERLDYDSAQYVLEGLKGQR
jgi:hypothetical protein